MFLTRLRLRNWRNFAEVDVPLQQRTFIVGPNAAGKSNLLDALWFLHETADNEVGFDKALKFRSGIQRLHSNYASDAKDPITIEIEMDDDPWCERAEWRYQITFAPKLMSDDKSFAGHIQCEEVWQRSQQCYRWSESADYADLPLRHMHPPIGVVDDSKVRRVADALGSIEFLDGIWTEPHRGDWVKSYNRRRREPRSTVFDEIFATPDTERASRLERIVQALRTFQPQLESLSVEMDPDGAGRLVATHAEWYGAALQDPEFSDGTAALLGMMWRLTQPGGPLLIEHPEHSLQVEVLPHLAWAFAFDNDPPMRQVIATTHSEELLRDHGIEPREVITIRPSTKGSVAADGSVDASAVSLAENGGSAGEYLLRSANAVTGYQLTLGL